MSGVANIIDHITRSTLDYAVLLAAIGTLSMAFLELAKSLAGARRRFHAWRLEQWMPDEQARRELVLLAAGGRLYAEALYDQAPERMLGQIQSAANIALDYPVRFPHLYGFLTVLPEEDAAQEAATGKHDSEVWRAYAAAMAGGGEKNGAPPDDRAAQQARARLGNLIARRLDSFQNQTQYLWARANQYCSVAIGAGIAYYALQGSSRFQGSQNIEWLIAASFVAGMIAPFAKDIVSALSGLRAKP